MVLAQQIERQPRLVGVQLDELAGTGRELVDVDVPDGGEDAHEIATVAVERREQDRRVVLREGRPVGDLDVGHGAAPGHVDAAAPLGVVEVAGEVGPRPAAPGRVCPVDRPETATISSQSSSTTRLISAAPASTDSRTASAMRATSCCGAASRAPSSCEGASPPARSPTPNLDLLRRIPRSRSAAD